MILLFGLKLTEMLVSFFYFSWFVCWMIGWLVLMLRWWMSCIKFFLVFKLLLLFIINYIIITMNSIVFHRMLLKGADVVFVNGNILKFGSRHWLNFKLKCFVKYWIKENFNWKFKKIEQAKLKMSTHLWWITRSFYFLNKKDIFDVKNYITAPKKICTLFLTAKNIANFKIRELELY